MRRQVNGIEAYPVEMEVNAGYGDTLLVIVVNKTPNARQTVTSELITPLILAGVRNCNA